MNDRERFRAIMSFEPFDRVPVYYFGLWDETLARWKAEGLPDGMSVAAATGMDEDWETNMWGEGTPDVFARFGLEEDTTHGLVNIGPVAAAQRTVIEESAEYRIVRYPIGTVQKESKLGSTVPQTLTYALEPTRASWDNFKRMLDPMAPCRYARDWREKAAVLNARTRVAAFFAGSLFDWPREWMGLEALSYLLYDDPILFEEILDVLTEQLIVLYEPILREASFDFGYVHEDCAFRSGPLMSPRVFEDYYAKYYRKLTDFYHRMGVPFVLVDSDGRVDSLVPIWLGAGFDIVFPIEVGVWRADPVDFRRRLGRQIRMFGGVNKLVIPRGETAIREELAPLVETVREGGFIPIPDHRIPPDCSLEQFRTYVRVFKEVFARVGSA